MDIKEIIIKKGIIKKKGGRVGEKADGGRTILSYLGKRCVIVKVF